MKRVVSIRIPAEVREKLDRIVLSTGANIDTIVTPAVIASILAAADAQFEIEVQS